MLFVKRRIRHPLISGKTQKQRNLTANLPNRRNSLNEVRWLNARIELSERVSVSLPPLFAINVDCFAV